jgi:hypothetical protein
VKVVAVLLAAVAATVHDGSVCVGVGASNGGVSWLSITVACIVAVSMVRLH